MACDICGSTKTVSYGVCSACSGESKHSVPNPTKRTTMKCFQDGSRFYNDATGDEVFESSIIVHDGNIDDAKAARAEFLAFADRFAFNVIWV